MFRSPSLDDGFDDMDRDFSRSPSPCNFEKTRLKRKGSDAFQAVMKQFDFSDEEGLSILDAHQLNFLDGVSPEQLGKRDKFEVKEDTDSFRISDSDCSLPGSSGSESGRYFKQKQEGHRVQWIDECFFIPLAHEPNDCEKHTGRIFVKTLPSKSILKHS